MPTHSLRSDVRKLLEFLALMSLPVIVFLFLAMAAWGLAPGYDWREWADDPNRLYLYRDGVQVGAYDLAECYYRPFDRDTGRWGPTADPPVVPPAIATGPGNQGVDARRISPVETYRLNGKLVPRAAAIGALAAGIPDDADRHRLTVIGGDADRERVLQDLRTHAALASLVERLVVQDYRPEEWAVRDAGFVVAGTPTIYLQKPDGTVIHRQDGYDGPEALASALRKPDPSYRPDRDLDLRRFLSWKLPAIPPVVWLLGGAALVYFFLGGKR